MGFTLEAMGCWPTLWQIACLLDFCPLSPIRDLAWVLMFKLGKFHPWLFGLGRFLAERSNKIGLCLHPTSFLPSFQSKPIRLYLPYLWDLWIGLFLKSRCRHSENFENYWFRSLPVLTPWCSKIRQLASDMSKPSTQGASLDRRDGCCPIGEGTLRLEWKGGRTLYTLIFERNREFLYSYSKSHC